jgi:hypothetical protein
VVSAGRPFLFVTGNHDSDTLVRRLVREGAVVLTERGRLEEDGGFGPVVFRFNGIRVAGYGDPNVRSAARGYRAPPDPAPTAGERASFATWLRGLRDDVDVVMVHAPALAETAIEALRADPPDHAIVLAVGHTHRPAAEEVAPNVTLLNGGTAGAGGSGNLAEGQPIGLAVLTYRREPFAPVAADLVEIDPGDGEVVGELSPADAKVEPAAGQDIQRGRHLRGQHRIAVWQYQHGGDEPQPLGCTSYHAEDREGLQRIADARVLAIHRVGVGGPALDRKDDVVRDHRRVQAQPLAFACQGENALARRGRAACREIEAVAHPDGA